MSRMRYADLFPALVALVLAGMVAALSVVVLFWPSDPETVDLQAPAVPARIVELVPAGEGLLWVVSETGGPSPQRLASLVWEEDVPLLAVGDRVRMVVASTPPPVALPDELTGAGYAQLVDFERSQPLLWLLALFVVVVVSVGRWWGVRALAGLALSLLVVLKFILPALLQGAPPPLVAWAGAMLIMLATLYLAHGFRRSTTVAAAGTTLSLALTVALGMFFVDVARISGFASENAQAAAVTVGGLNLKGLVLGGLIIATLGVLDDVTVSQTSTVYALAATDRSLAAGELFTRAMRVGRDHIASVVNTLFLAYTGASLALLVLFETSGLPVGEIVTSELVAEEVVKTLVGSIGLVAAVPVTTALAALIAARPAEGHAPVPT